MSKSDEIRAVFRRCEPIFASEVAREVGCTKPLVFQMIRVMEDEGRIFDSRQVGHEVRKRMLPPDEETKRKQARAKMVEDAKRRAELKSLRESLEAARTSIDDALVRIQALAS